MWDILLLTLIVINSAYGANHFCRSPLATEVLGNGARVTSAARPSAGRASLISSARGYADGNLASHLMKDDSLCSSVIDVHDIARRTLAEQNLARILVESNSASRFNAIKNFPIERIMAAPGHSMLRSPEKVLGLSDYIAGTARASFSEDKLILNIITDESGNIKFVDGWNGHHRLVAYLKAGKSRVSDILEENLTILVNGKTTEDDVWKHWVPAHGVDLNTLLGYTRAQGADFATLSVSGELSNFAMGARTTVAGLLRNTLGRVRPKIGVFFGSFDPPHLGHMETASAAMEKFGLDRVVFIPNRMPLHKPNITNIGTRLEMLGDLIGPSERLNLYIGDNSKLVTEMGNESLLRRIGQLYGTNNIFQIQGSDAMGKLMGLRQVNPEGYSKYLVLPRDQASRSFFIPENLRQAIFYIDDLVPHATSSSKIRAWIKEGSQLAKRFLDPATYRYITERQMYR